MTGFSTRAIRSSTRAPRVERRRQAPVPAREAVTSCAEDAQDSDELGALTGRVRGYAHGRLDDPATAALGASGDAVGARSR